jgi:hypothetical protein
LRFNVTIALVNLVILIVIVIFPIVVVVFIVIITAFTTINTINSLLAHRVEEGSDVLTIAVSESYPDASLMMEYSHNKARNTYASKKQSVFLFLCAQNRHFHMSDTPDMRIRLAEAGFSNNRQSGIGAGSDTGYIRPPVNRPISDTGSQLYEWESDYEDNNNSDNEDEYYSDDANQM